MMTVYVLTVEADAGRGDYIGTTSVHATPEGALAALRTHYEQYGDWYAECGVMDWEDFQGAAHYLDPTRFGDQMDGFIGADVALVTGTECDGLYWGINAYLVKA